MSITSDPAAAQATPPVRILILQQNTMKLSHPLAERVRSELAAQGFQPVESCDSGDRLNHAALTALETPPCDAQAVLRFDGLEDEKDGGVATVWRWRDGQLVVRQRTVRATRERDRMGNAALQTAGWVRAQFVEFSPPEPEPPEPIVTERIVPPPPTERGVVSVHAAVGASAGAPGRATVGVVGVHADFGTRFVPSLELGSMVTPTTISRDLASASVFSASARILGNVVLTRPGDGGVCMAGGGGGALHVRTRGSSDAFTTQAASTTQPILTARLSCHLPVSGRILGVASLEGAWSPVPIDVIFDDAVVATGARPLVTGVVGIAWR